ncbi:FecR family protein [Anseongella ginsenosidimutans]|uniref:FecR family protein n=1 Tax=Anseongella ginsenosidimutans TaxID=496056 RepID=A0A4R3KYX1_9SPHI|nr:FecR domain-containing protein [Anseongella ginsenosidimutans]QEC51467.1 DUF4974 domain-containing protein [Anseongella ginsenosidimutans]TCS89820.1 FecR family protein [Anseongella ginsenosidimutans]
MQYQDYTVKDFLLDERFRKWVMNPDPEIEAFWESWLLNNSEKAEEVQQAREVLQLIRFRQHQASPEEQAQTWERIGQTIRDERPVIPLPGASPSRRVLTRRLRYAAALAALLMVVSLAFYFYYRAPVSHDTAYGEISTIVLPDNSIVKLNANSHLRYTRSWDNERPREIWLEGEAFFSVVHKSNNQQFLVHTNDMTVKVTGTEFNVNTRHIATKVVLNNGAVELLLNPGTQKQDAKNRENLLMKPGDMISWSYRTGKLISARVDPELYSSWRTNILRFKGTPILEVARSLQDNFGIAIRFEDRELLEETFTGTIPMDNVDVFFKTLSRTFNVEIIRNDKEIIIVKR